jgi:hypothetical protein
MAIAAAASPPPPHGAFHRQNWVRVHAQGYNSAHFFGTALPAARVVATVRSGRRERPAAAAAAALFTITLRAATIGGPGE